MAGVGAGIDHDNGSMTITSTLAGVLIGLVVGFPAGVLFAVARRGWNDVGAAKRAVPTARKTAFKRTREALFLGLLLFVAGAVAIGIYRGR
jgi:hypothetical protein